MWTDIQFFANALPAPIALPASLCGLAGAWAEFRGYVRADEAGHKIGGLRYEIYEPMARQQIVAHFVALETQFKITGALLWHRSGPVAVGEASIYAAFAAPHRREAFAALAEFMDRLKKDVPIWKAETLRTT